MTYAQITLTPEAREDLRKLKYALMGRALRKVTMSDAIQAACRVAMAEIDRANEALEEL